MTKGTVSCSGIDTYARWGVSVTQEDEVFGYQLHAINIYNCRSSYSTYDSRDAKLLPKRLDLMLL